jgi:hypothetical protein
MGGPEGGVLLTHHPDHGKPGNGNVKPGRPGRVRQQKEATKAPFQRKKPTNAQRE